MKKSYLQLIIMTLLGLSLLIAFGCDKTSTETDEIELFDQIDVTLIDNWDLYEIKTDSLRSSSMPAKFLINLGRDMIGYPALVEEFYLSVSTNEVVIDGQPYNSVSEDIKTLHLIDNQLYTVNANDDTTYYYDYYRNTESGVLWMIPDDSPHAYYAVDPTLVDSIMVITGEDTIYYDLNINDYLMLYKHGMGPELKLTTPEFNTQVTNLTPAFSWAGNSASEYLFQVRTDTLFNSNDGFVYNQILQTNSFTVPAANPLNNFTSYYWRVKADNSDWSAVWNFGTYYIVTLSSPLNTEQVCRKPSIIWNSYNGASDYTLHIAKDVSFSEDLIEVLTASTNHVHNDYFEDGQKYYWRVKADNSGENWSEIRYFTIQKKVALSDPANAASSVLFPVTFNWNTLQNAANYNLQIATDEEMVNIVLDESLTTNSYVDSLSLAYNTEYFWQVNSDVATEWSVIRSFITNDVVLLQQPENEAENLGIILEFEWIAFPGTVDYTIQIAEDDNFANLVLETTGITENSFIPEIDFTGNTDYYWRVKHNSSAWSEAWQFTTMSLHELDEDENNPLAPQDEGSGIAQLPTLNWPNLSGADFFRVQLSDDENFNNLIVNHVGTSSQYTLDESEGEILTLTSSYYWRFRGDKTEWSDVWSFTTLDGIPYDFEASVQPETPHKIDLTWLCQSGEQTAYNLERSQDEINWDLIAEISADKFHYSDLGLSENSTFKYRINTANPTGNSDYSELVEATTGTFLLGANEPVFANVGAGTFEMGSATGDDDEEPLRTITLTNDLKVGIYEITNQQYCTLLNWALGKGLVKGKLGNYMNYAANAVNYSVILHEPDDSDLQIEYMSNDYKFKVNSGYEDYPITSVTWQGAAAYTNWLSIVKGLTSLYDTSWNCTVYGSNGYRLPTEAEWEYAARAAGSSTNYLYSGSNNVDDVAWYLGNTAQINPVGNKSASEIGTYDMSGNVWEWCNDYYGPYDPAQTIDPTGANSGTHRVIRGGSWEYEAYYLRNANRGKCKPNLAYGKVNTNIGFRIIEILP